MSDQDDRRPVDEPRPDLAPQEEPIWVDPGKEETRGAPLPPEDRPDD